MNKKINREIGCKNEIADILNIYNCNLVADIVIDREMYDKISQAIEKNNEAKIRVHQDHIHIISEAENEKVDTGSTS